VSEESKAAALTLTAHHLELLKGQAKAADNVAQAARRAQALPAADADEVHAVTEWINSHVDVLIKRIGAQIPRAEPERYPAG
jgi:hypothetical protein